MKEDRVVLRVLGQGLKSNKNQDENLDNDEFKNNRSMSEPHWILESVVLKLYEQQMKEHGGEYGIRDIGLLQSALAHSKNLWQYKKSSLHNLAAGYAARICANHPFIDGNKRGAYVVMRLFLKINGKDMDSSLSRND